jgi:hypothetical protein
MQGKTKRTESAALLTDKQAVTLNLSDPARKLLGKVAKLEGKTESQVLDEAVIYTLRDLAGL